jgi:lysophospholipase L1-like esterase
MKRSTRNILIVVGTSVVLLGLMSFFIVRKRRNKINCKDNVLFLGNSQTANTSGYVEKLQKHCKNSNFTKVAKVGAKSDWILNEYKNLVEKGKKYDWVSVMIGGNDIFARLSIDKTKRNLQELFELANKNGSKIMFISSPSKKFYDKSTPRHIELAMELENWVKENKLVNVFIPISKVTANENLFRSDMLHINNEGQEVVFKEILKKAKFK